MDAKESRFLRLFDIRGIKADIDYDQEIKTSFAFNFGTGIRWSKKGWPTACCGYAKDGDIFR
jgi:hypothetical protein